MRLFITIIFILIAYSASASEYKKVYEDSKMQGFVIASEPATDGFVISTKIKMKSRMKKSNTVVVEDLVLNCTENTYHTEKSVTTYNGVSEGTYRWTEDETEIYEGFPLRLKVMYCDSNLKEITTQECVSVKYRDADHERFVRVLYGDKGIALCE